MNAKTDLLLINRNQKDTEQIANVLHKAGYTVHTTMEMRGALSALSAFPVGLIICDKDLQDISGNDFLGFIKKDPLRETIPFMFLVPLKDQGRPVEALERGAIDYLVYPMDSKAFIARIGEVLKPVAPALHPPQPGPPPPQGADAPPRKEQPSSAKITVPPIIVDISRDGVIWLPGKIKAFCHQSLSVETALFGKSGVSVMIRLQHPEGTYIINGRIQKVTCDDFQKPAGLEIEVEADDTWHCIHADLEKAATAASTTGTARGVAGGAKPPDANQTTGRSGTKAKRSEVDGPQTKQAASKKDTSYDTRFYYSIIGKQLDNYRAITLIGIGNMGGVLQGWDVALEREVALKIISYHLSSKENFRELFIKEARVVSKLNHPNIAQIYHIGSSNDILYYAMEFIDGITLKELIERKGNLDYTEGLDCLITVCEALEIVSRHAIVHRDIKPANIMITNTGVIKIVDFGAAKSSDVSLSGTGKNTLMGTPFYMSPEQIARLAIDHRSDMYSLGAAFYHAFCGAPPFKSKDIKSILRQHLNNEVIPLCDKNPKISADLSEIIAKMMAKDPNHRFASFKAIVDQLKPLRC